MVGIVKDIEKCKRGLKCNLDKNDIINIDVKEWGKVIKFKKH